MIAAGRIRLRGCRLLRRSPESLPAGFEFSRAGKFLGPDRGDALGNTWKVMTGRSVIEVSGIRDYPLHPRCGDPRGYPPMNITSVLDAGSGDR